MKKPPEALSSMLGQVLSNVAQKTGSGAPLAPIWQGVVGPVMAQHSRAVSLAQGVLVVHVDAAAWRDELERHQAELISKLSATLGVGVVRSLRIEVL